VQIQQQQQDFGTIFASLRLRQLMDNVQNTYFCQTNGDSITDEVNCNLPIYSLEFKSYNLADSPFACNPEFESRFE